MQSFTTSLMLAGSSLLLLAACADAPADLVGAPPPQASAEPGIQQAPAIWVEDVTGVMFQVQCEPGVQSEVITLEGQLVYRFNVIVDGRGGVHINSSIRPDGLRGIGQDSGEEYRVAEQAHESWLTTPTVRSGAYYSRITMVGRTSKQRFTVLYTGLFVVNANDELVVARSDYQVECR
ncbi:MAG TPA: hypothetical protein VK939_17645 [Longimicrobiales bacterium]|nr:hypothetical protein [Longimicrobiales bacterium]